VVRRSHEHKTTAGVEIEVRVIPRARKSAIDGVRDDALVVRLTAAPVEGAANDALVELLAHHLDIPKRAVRIISGDRGRRKRVALDGISAADARSKLGI
jgi:uncharacterized protein (TIGR00251 family)